MQVNFDGQEYTLDLDEITLGEARYIKRNTGLSLMKLQAGLTDGDPDALAALYWLMLKQSGKVQDINKMDFLVVKFTQALGEASEPDEDAEADPTEPAQEPAPATT